MISLRRLPSPKKGGSFDLTITRMATGEKFKLLCINEDHREKVEKCVMKLFKTEIENVTIVDESGTMVKMVEP